MQQGCAEGLQGFAHPPAHATCSAVAKGDLANAEFLLRPSAAFKTYMGNNHWDCDRSGVSEQNFDNNLILLKPD